MNSLLYIGFLGSFTRVICDNQNDTTNEVFYTLVVIAGSNVSASCHERAQVDLTTFAKQVWRREQILTFPDGSSERKQALLQLENVQREDAGVYNCYTDGNLYRQVNILVKYSPVLLPIIIPAPRNKSMASIGCVAEGFPPPQITWSWNGTSDDYITEAIVSESTLLGDAIANGFRKAWALGNYELNKTEDFEEIQMNITARFTASLLTFSNSSRIPKDLTCRGDNVIGSAALAFFQPNQEKPSDSRRSNPTAFVIAMLPPIHIGFYIVCVLACKSGLGEHSPWAVVKEGWNDSDD